MIKVETVRLVAENAKKDSKQETQGIIFRWLRRYMLFQIIKGRIKSRIDKIRQIIGKPKQDTGEQGLHSQLIVAKSGQIYYGHHTRVLEKAIHY